MPTSPTARIDFHQRVARDEIVHEGGGVYRETTPEERERMGVMREDRQAALLVEQRQRQERQRIVRCQSLWQSSGVPPRYFEADLDALGEVPAEYSSVAQELREMRDKPILFGLVGGRGGGKTHLACGMVRHFCRAGKIAKYMTALGIFRAIRASFDKQRGAGEGEAAIVEKLVKLDLLVIDEVQVRSESVFENNVLTDLIDQRYNTIRATLLISNLTPAELQVNVGDSITSRMIGSGKLNVCKWKSFRTAGAEIIAPPRTWQNGKPVFSPVMDGAVPTDGTPNCQEW